MPDIFDSSFKSEVRSSGAKLFQQEKIGISTLNDTELTAYARTTPPARVQISTPSMESAKLEASCNCPASQKDKLCKHIWATLLLVESKHPDFLEAKTEIDLKSDAEPAEIKVETKPKANLYQETAKQKAADYRKEQYQKQKQRLKEKKGKSKAAPVSFAPSLPADVDQALDYFATNGFELRQDPSQALLTEAKRKLSRIFHPDKGGTHEESVELNQNFEILENYFGA